MVAIVFGSHVRIARVPTAPWRSSLASHSRSTSSWKTKGAPEHAEIPLTTAREQVPLTTAGVFDEKNNAAQQAMEEAMAELNWIDGHAEAQE